MRTGITLVLLLAAGCASTGEKPIRGRDVLTLQEIHDANQTNALDLIRGLRPHWLRTRGPNSFFAENPIMVYVDGTRVGGLGVLNSIPKLHIKEMRFYKPAEAQARFGLNNTNGAIAIRTREE